MRSTATNLANSLSKERIRLRRSIRDTLSSIHQTQAGKVSTGRTGEKQQDREEAQTGFWERAEPEHRCRLKNAVEAGGRNWFRRKTGDVRRPTTKERRISQKESSRWRDGEGRNWMRRKRKPTRECLYKPITPASVNRVVTITVGKRRRGEMVKPQKRACK